MSVIEYQQQDVYMIPASDRPVQAWEHVSTPQSRQITPAQHVNSMRPHSSTPAGKNEGNKCDSFIVANVIVL